MSAPQRPSDADAGGRAIAASRGRRGRRGVRGGGASARHGLVRLLVAAAVVLSTAACRAGGPAGGAGTPGAGTAIATPSTAALEALKGLDALVGAGKLDDAVALAAQWVEREPNVVEIRLAYGIVLSRRDGFAAAVPALEQALALDERHIPTLAALAMGYDEDGDAEHAAAYAQRILAVDPRSGVAAALSGRSLLDRGDYDGALAILTPAQGSGRADVFSLMGRAYARKGDAAKAEQAFRRALDLDPRSLEAMLNLGQLLQRGGRTAEGQQLLDRHKELSAEADAVQFAEQSSQMAGAGTENFLMLGEARRKQGDAAGAEAAFKSAAARAPDDARPLIGLTTVAMDRGAHDEALAYARQAVAVGGQLPLAHLLLGVELVRAGQFQEAEPVLDRARRLAPWQAREWDMLGQALVDADHLGDAERAYEEAQKLAPADDVIALRLGYLRYAQRDFAGARDGLRAAAERSANNGDLALALALTLDQLGDPAVASALGDAVARYARQGAGTAEQNAAKFRLFAGGEATLQRFLALSAARAPGATPSR